MAHAITMKKKVALRILVFLLPTAAGFLYLSPYHRQLFFGPKIQGLPLCVWQDYFREASHRSELEQSSVMGFVSRILPERQKVHWDELTCSEKQRLLFSLKSDGDVWVRKQVVRSLADLDDATALQEWRRFLVDRDGDVRSLAMDRIQLLEKVLSARGQDGHEPK